MKGQSPRLCCDPLPFTTTSILTVFAGVVAIADAVRRTARREGTKQQQGFATVGFGGAHIALQRTMNEVVSGLKPSVKGHLDSSYDDSSTISRKPDKGYRIAKRTQAPLQLSVSISIDGWKLQERFGRRRARNQNGI